jgi:hypothetical protein
VFLFNTTGKGGGRGNLTDIIVPDSGGGSVQNTQDEGITVTVRGLQVVISIYKLQAGNNT